MGLSTFKPYRRLLDWPDGVVELADNLPLDRFAVVGFSGGGPYALACAYKIPHRLTACTTVREQLMMEPYSVACGDSNSKRSHSLKFVTVGVGPRA